MINLKGSSLREYFEVLSQHLQGTAEENHEISVTDDEDWPKIKTWGLQNMTQGLVRATYIGSINRERERETDIIPKSVASHERILKVYPKESTFLFK
jgi:hypothetical protein